MYAVIETGGKQYRVEVGTELEVELLDAEAGASITLDRVLLIADGGEAAIGRPLVPNATVSADVIRQVRGEKTISFKYRPKARRRVTKGHRQELTLLRISDIVLDGHSAASDVAAAREAERSERDRVEEAARRQAAADAELAARLAAKNPPSAAAAKAPRRGSRPTGSESPKSEAKSKAKADATSDAKSEAKAPPKGRASASGSSATKTKPADGSAQRETPKKPRTTKKDG